MTIKFHKSIIEHKNRCSSPLPFSFITSRYHCICISEAYNRSCIFILWVRIWLMAEAVLEIVLGNLNSLVQKELGLFLGFDEDLEACQLVHNNQGYPWRCWGETVLLQIYKGLATKAQRSRLRSWWHFGRVCLWRFEVGGPRTQAFSIKQATILLLVRFSSQACCFPL